MPKPKSKTTKKKLKTKRNHQQYTNRICEYPPTNDLYNINFVSEAGPGCHIAHPSSSDWICGWEVARADDFDNVDDIPDVAIDTEEGTLSVCNVHNYSIVAYISVYDVRLKDTHGQLLEQGMTMNDAGETFYVTTIIALCPPETFAHLCYFENKLCIEKLDQLKLESDVQQWREHPDPTDVYDDITLAFPLQTSPDVPAFLCTQGIHGHLTHFFSGNYHAIDFRCPVGTPLLAVAAGTVIQVQDHHTCTGIAVSNLFEWNSILLKIDTPPENPLFVEYVHIQTAHVFVGDIVQQGQVIGTSGSVGFSPEPHLHFAAYRSDHPTAPTVQVSFAGKDGPYVPCAHSWYSARGQVGQVEEK